MSFPDWGHSYNALYVPLLQWGWQCALMPFREVDEVDRSWSLSYEDRKKRRKEQKEQMEQDRQDFDRLFRVRIDRRGSAASSDFCAYVAFLREHLLRSVWNAPVDGEGITRVLRTAVRNGHLVPVIDRAWYGGQRVFRHYAPQHWKRAASGGNYGRSERIYTAGEFAALRRKNGETGGFGLLAANARLNSVRGVASDVEGAASCREGHGSVDWLGLVEEAGGAMLVGTVSDDRGESMLRGFGVDSNGGSLLGDTPPFEYRPDSLDDDVTELAARGVSEVDEAECFANYEIDLEMCSAGSAMYQSPAYYLACKTRAFQRYQRCRGY